MSPTPPHAGKLPLPTANSSSPDEFSTKAIIRRSKYLIAVAGLLLLFIITTAALLLQPKSIVRWLVVVQISAQAWLLYKWCQTSFQFARAGMEFYKLTQELERNREELAKLQRERELWTAQRQKILDDAELARIGV